MTATKSCFDCPAFVGFADRETGKQTWGCRKYGNVIFNDDLSSLTAGEVATSLASTCPSFGAADVDTFEVISVTAKPSDFSLSAATDFSLTSHTEPKPANASCLNCSKCVTVVDPLGAHTPDTFACKVNGANLAIGSPSESTEEELVAKAGKCPWWEDGIPEAPVTIHPVFANPADGLAVMTGELPAPVAPAPITEAVPPSAASTTPAEPKDAPPPYFPDPLDYPTDKPVDERDKGIIHAWRAVTIPTPKHGEQTIFTPIFEPEFFDAEWRREIPRPGDDEKPELYLDHLGLFQEFTKISYFLNQNLTFVGEAGSGKTDAARHAAYMTQMPFTHLQVDADTLPEEFLGRTRIDMEKGDYFEMGKLPRSLSVPGVVLTDEVNLGPDSILQAYRALHSPSGTITLHADSGTVIRKHDYCYNVLAINPPWDPRNIGAKEMADPDVSRLSFVWVSEPPEKEIMKIIVAKVEAAGMKIDKEDLALMMKVRTDIKEFSKNGTLPFSWSIRQDVKVAGLLFWYPPAEAYRRAILDYIQPEAASAVLAAVRSIFGG